MIEVGAVAGIITLSKTWCTNLMIAAQKLGMLNKLNVWSTVVSFIFIFFIPQYGLIMAVLLIISQPLIFIISALWLNSELRPAGVIFSKKLLRKLMLFGFIPFLAGILVKTDDQVERWGIINILGIENFGKYNLVIIYCSVFMLVPASINPIFFPKAILQYKENNFAGLKKTIKLYVATLMSYAFVTFCITILLMPYVVNLLLPKYNIGVPYVWYILPYLAAQILVMPLDFMYTLTAKFRVMFVSYIMSVILFIILIFVITNMAQKKLEYFAIAKSIDGLLFVICSSLGYYFFIRKTFLEKQ
jgi:O-antigen/teichoic acid export membrane protein